ncbi:MAG: hypothetical protein U9P37_06775 [Pseudomonadota bacterium]|nr:hypothetical protein [Pseudomonadota bacterium]
MGAGALWTERWVGCGMLAEIDTSTVGRPLGSRSSRSSWALDPRPLALMFIRTLPFPDEGFQLSAISSQVEPGKQVVI